MYRTTLLALAVAVAFTGLSGCGTVTLTSPIGQPLATGLDQWSGIWMLENAPPSSGDRVIYLKGEADGVLRCAFIEWEDGDFQLGKFDCLVTALADRRFLHIDQDTIQRAEERVKNKDRGAEADRASDDTAEPTYGFVLLEQPEPDVLLISIPVTKAFASAIESKSLIGEQTSRFPRKVIVRDKVSLDRLITQTPSSELFDSILKLKRVGSFNPDLTLRERTRIEKH